NQVQNMAQQVGGDPAAFVVDLGLWGQNYYTQLGAASVNTVAGVLQGENPLKVFAAPLAGAIRAARERHLGNAMPLPDDVQAGLAAYIPASTISRAKYVVGRVEITLPNFIGKGQMFMGSDYAVVVDDIIVFSSTPPS